MNFQEREREGGREVRNNGKDPPLK